jgi:methionyl-tRNA formyltransferase
VTLSPGQVAIEGACLLVGCGKDKESRTNTTIELLEIQLEGKRRMTAQEFINGYRPKPGDRLGQ